MAKNFPDFKIVPKLSTALYPWTAFPQVGDQSIHEYLTAVFAGKHGFATLGDFQETPVAMVEQLRFAGLALLYEVNVKVSYDINTYIRERIFDTLGCYNTKTRTITLFIQSIAKCALDLDQIPGNSCAPCVMTLTTMVFLHELGHAIHHALRWKKYCTDPAQGLNEKRGENNIFDDDFINELTPEEVAADDLGDEKDREAVAQHFMMTCIRAQGVHGAGPEWIEKQLDPDETTVYSEWRKCERDFHTTWDGCRELLEKYS